MIHPYLFGLVLLLGSSGNARLSDGNEDKTLEMLKEIVRRADENTLKNNLSEVAIGKASYNLLLFQVLLDNGVAGNLSTVALRGDDRQEVMNRTDGDSLSIFSYDLQLGIDQLTVEYDFSVNYFGLFTGSPGKFLLTNKDNVFRVLGTVIRGGTSDSCNATLDHVAVESLGTFEAQVIADPRQPLIMVKVINFFIDHILHFFHFVVNNKLIYIALHDIPKSDFQKIVCDSLPS